eukprot:1394938-Amorphochlora_amoeboformis.AAC.1
MTSFKWPLRSVPSYYVPPGATPKSLAKGLSKLQQLVNRCNEAMMQIAEFAASQPSFIFPCANQIHHIARA